MSTVTLSDLTYSTRTTTSITPRLDITYADIDFDTLEWAEFDALTWVEFDEMDWS